MREDQHADAPDAVHADPDVNASIQEEPSVPPEIEEFAAGSAAADGLPATRSEDWRERWLRAEADLQNFRRRAARDREEAVRHAEDRILLEMVTVLDDLERALASLEGEAAALPWTAGVALTAQTLRDALARAGVEPMDSVGQPFDPERHEAMLEIDAPEGVKPGAVAQELLRGYRRGERTLRPARVMVARAPQDAG